MKIKCCTCKNELNRKCTVKETTINPNKTRCCNDYELDTEREMRTIQAKVRRRDYHTEQYYEKQRQRAAATRPAATEEHPLTGDLSRFTTTASKAK